MGYWSDFAGYVCIVFYKKIKLYKICISDDKTEKFQDLLVSPDSTELVNSYYISHYKWVAKSCRDKLVDKVKYRSDFFKLSKEDLEELQDFLSQERAKSREQIRKENEFEKNVEKEKVSFRENLTLRKREYRTSSRYKRFVIRHKNKLVTAINWITLGFLFGLLYFPFTMWIFVKLGVPPIWSWYYPSLPYLLIYWVVFSFSYKADKHNIDDILKDEDFIIKDRFENWEKVRLENPIYKFPWEDKIIEKFDFLGRKR